MIAMAINGLGAEKRTYNPPPVTLPKLVFRESDIEAEIQEAARVIVERKIIRQGADAWEAIKKSESFTGWLAIGKALQVGKEFALKSTGANQAWGRNYSRAFCDWIKRYHFERMPPPTRSVAIELAEHADEITKWRDSLPERQRKRLIHPLSVTRRWRAATTYNGKSPTDLKREATAALARFISCMKLLPPEQAAPLWREAQAQAASYLP